MAPHNESPDQILLVEDDPDVLDLVRYNLTKAGFSVTLARDGLAGLKAARTTLPDLVVLDLMLPEMRGEDVCRGLKSDPSTSAIPVIMLTAKAQAADRVAGLELGADDYVTKPFSPRELILRIEGLLRRARSAGPGEKLRVGPFELDRGTFEIRLDGAKLDLTGIEFKLLAMMMEKRGHPLKRELLLRDVWGYRSVVDSRTVDTHMRRLRGKLGEHAARLETVRGEGYVFRTREDD
ncbi:MAG: response regulator transcription factor [Chthoniobacterales bacterium]|nr:response regulator transcription factor [Chthoniobacterales bacterium]